MCVYAWRDMIWMGWTKMDRRMTLCCMFMKWKFIRTRVSIFSNNINYLPEFDENKPLKPSGLLLTQEIACACATYLLNTPTPQLHPVLKTFFKMTHLTRQK